MRMLTVVLRIAPATILVTLGMLPVFLVSSLSVLMGAEVGLTESRVGIAIAVNFLVAMLVSYSAGQLTQRLGARVGFALGALGTVLGLLLVASAGTWRTVLVAMAFSGGATAFVEVAANLRIAMSIPPARLGVAYSVKQSAIPMATLSAGLAVPLVAAVLPWRWVFMLAALGVAMAWFVQRSGASAISGDEVRSTARLRWPPLAVLSLGIGGAAAAATSMSAFLVPFLVSIDVSARNAGLALAIGSIATIVGRISVGLARDRWDLDGLAVVPIQTCLGAAALFLIARPSTEGPLLGVAIMIGFSAGWAWSGIFTDAVVRRAPAAAAATTGVTQAGVYLGSGGGPLAFGLLAEHQGYPAAWLTSAALFLMSTVLIVAGRRLLDRRGRAGGVAGLDEERRVMR